jgi:uncharacterized protein (DUF302 family)
MNYGMMKTTPLAFDDAIAKVTEELKKEGFGILTSIDVQETLKKKINVDFRKYVILGACNPAFANQALRLEEELGLLLPCNVIVYEKEGATVVGAFDPEAMTKLSDNPALGAIASEVRVRLERVIAAL